MGKEVVLFLFQLLAYKDICLHLRTARTANQCPEDITPQPVILPWSCQLTVAKHAKLTHEAAKTHIFSCSSSHTCHLLPRSCELRFSTPPCLTMSKDRSKAPLFFIASDRARICSHSLFSGSSAKTATGSDRSFLLR